MTAEPRRVWVLHDYREHDVNELVVPYVFIDPSKLDPAMVERAAKAYDRAVGTPSEWMRAALVAALTVEGDGG